MTDIKKQCFAYNAQGDRCEKKPGHAGDHVVMLAWDDTECFNPLDAIVPLAQIHSRLGDPLDGPSIAPVAQATEVPEEGRVIEVTEHGTIRRFATPTAPSNKCIACGHSHRGGVCKCECYEHIG